jgi:histone deacetylase 11
MKRILVYFLPLFFSGCTLLNAGRKRAIAGTNRVVPNRVSIVFSPEYDITCYGLESFHSFDGAKYGKVYDGLTKQVSGSIEVYRPAEITDAELKRVHTPEYLQLLRDNASSMMAGITELALIKYLPNSIVRTRLQRPMRLAVGGTVLAAQLALKYGIAINLSGGYHHAKSSSGEGFCAYADIPLAVYTLLDSKRVERVLVVDLDAHQGNGLESIFASDQRVHVFDVYNADVYPQDKEVEQYIKYNHPVASFITDDEYLPLLYKHLPKAIKFFKPDLIVYNAGTDIYEADPLGCMSISSEGIKQRDQFVFEVAGDIPVVMVLSGGYTKESASIITHSLVNIINLRKES